MTSWHGVGTSAASTSATQSEHAPMGNVSKLLAFISLVLLIFGCYTAVRNGHYIWSYYSCQWECVRGRVVSSVVEHFGTHQSQLGPRDRGRYEIRISFEYWVSGILLSGNRISLDAAHPHAKDAGDLDEFLERYPVGRAVDVWYASHDPGISVLERRFGWDTVAGTVFGVLLALGGCFVGALAWRLRRYIPSD